MANHVARWTRPCQHRRRLAHERTQLHDLTISRHRRPFTSPAEDNGTFVKQGDGSFIYTTPEQVKIYRTSAPCERSRA